MIDENMETMDSQEEVMEDTQKDKYLTFIIDQEEYAIDIQYVMEIIGYQPITDIPEIAEYVQGIINLRGKVIPIIDVRLRFKKPFREYNDRTCIIVINIDGVDVGFIVDAVSEVLNIPAEKIVDPPARSTGFSNRYIKGIAKNKDKVQLILDCKKVLDYEEIEEILKET